MREGRLSFQHAAIISDEGMIISDPQGRSRYEEAVIEYALRETVGRLRPVAKKLAAEHTDHDHDVQHDEARKRRHVRLHDHADGIAEITAYLPAVGAYAIYDRLTRMAWKIKGLKSGNAQDVSEAEGPCAVADSRSLDEIRADVMADLLAAGTPSEELAKAGLDAITARVQVMVPARILDADAGEDADADVDTDTDASANAAAGADAGSDASAASNRHGAGIAAETGSGSGSGSDTETSIGRVAFLIGYGPIDSATARDLAARAPTWDTAFFNPLDGTILSTDRYRPNHAQRRRLRIRDMHCRFPGCRAPVQRCDLDHTIAACDGGPTNTRNISALCRPHHRLKHHTEWNVTQLPGGIMKWVSPTGRTHYDTPVSRVMFRETDARVTSSKSRTKKPSRSSEVLREYRANTSRGIQSDEPHPF